MASIIRLLPPAGPAAAPSPRARLFGHRLVDLAAALGRRGRTRRELRRLTDWQLRDIGLERADVADPLVRDLGRSAGPWWV